MIAVSASSRRDSVAGFSSYGDYVDVAAPGINILSTWVTDRNPGYESESGTSMASPMVAGAAALILLGQPEPDPGAGATPAAADRRRHRRPRLRPEVGLGPDQPAARPAAGAQRPAAGQPRPRRTPPAPAANQSRIQGTVTGVRPDLVDVLLLPQNGAPARDIQPDAAGLYVFDSLPAGKYTVQLAIKSGGFDFPRAARRSRSTAATTAWRR